MARKYSNKIGIYLWLNQLDALISQIYLWNKTVHVWDSSSANYQEFLTVHTAMVYVIQVCWQLASRIRTFLPDPARKLRDIYPCCVYSEKTPDVGQRNCPKHVEFYSKNKFEILVHVVGFIIRIYQDARSAGEQNWNNILTKQRTSKTTCLFSLSHLSSKRPLSYSAHILLLYKITRVFSQWQEFSLSWTTGRSKNLYFCKCKDQLWSLKSCHTIRIKKLLPQG